MVQLILSSTKGNQGGKYFPYLGFLGLTPIRVEGIVRTKLDSDLKLLPCTSLTVSVRCYEHRIGRVNVTSSKLLVDYTQVLWLKPDDVEYEPIGVRDYSFRITLPTHVAGFSTAVFVDYRCTWRVEAVLTHAPITGVGSRQIRHFELPLTRYDLPKQVSMPAGSSAALDQCTSKPRAPRIRYSLEAPTHPVGPSETVSIALRMQPVESNVTVKSATVLIERRIQLHDPQSTSSPKPPSSPIPIPNPSGSLPSQSQPTTPPSASPKSPSTPLSSSHGSYFSSQRQPSHALSSHTSSSDNLIPLQPSPDPAASSHNFVPRESTTSLASSNPTITPNTLYPSAASILSYSSEVPLLPSSPSSPAQAPQSLHNSPQPPHSVTVSATASSTNTAKVVVNPIVGTETESFTRDAKGIWSQMLTLEWPTSKSHSRWAIGETISSEFVTVKYFIRVKISVSSPVGGTDTIELGEKELVVVSTSEQERQTAQATYAELVESGRVTNHTRSTSKSPRRSRPEKDGEIIPPSPAPYRGAGTSSHTGASSSSSRAKAPRRPHTSAGPRDKSNFSAAKNGTSDPHKKRRSEAGCGAMGLPAPVGLSEAGGQSKTTGEIWKKIRSSSSGKLSSSSFWAVTAPPLKNQSSSGSSGRGVRSLEPNMRSTSSTSTTASSSSVSSSRSFACGKGRGTGESSTEEDERENEMRRRYYGKQDQQRPTSQSDQAAMGSPRRDSTLRPLNDNRPPPSSFNPAIVAGQPDGGHAVREWEEELARIEDKSRKESDLVGFTRLRKKSFVSAMKDLLPSRNKVFSFGDDPSS